jgi:hypothetical protein
MVSRTRRFIVVLSAVVAPAAIGGCGADQVGTPVGPGSSIEPRVEFVQASSEGGAAALSHLINRLEVIAQDPVQRQRTTFGTTTGPASLNDVLTSLRGLQQPAGVLQDRVAQQTVTLEDETCTNCTVTGASDIMVDGEPPSMRHVTFEAWTGCTGCEQWIGSSTVGGDMQMELVPQFGTSWQQSYSYSDAGEFSLGSYRTLVVGDSYDANLYTRHWASVDWAFDPPDFWSLAQTPV